MFANAKSAQTKFNRMEVQLPLKRMACWSDCDEQIMPEPADSTEHTQVSVSAPGSSMLLFKNRRRTPLLRAQKKRRLLALNPLRGSAHAAAFELSEQREQQQQKQQMGTLGLQSQSGGALTTQASNMQGSCVQAWTPVIALLLPQQLLVQQHHPSGCGVACVSRQNQLAAPSCSGGLMEQRQPKVQQLVDHLRNELQQQQPGRSPQQQQPVQQNTASEQQQQLKQALLQLLAANSKLQQEARLVSLSASASSAAAAAATAPTAAYQAVTQATRELSLASTYASPAAEQILHNELLQQVKTAAAHAAVTGTQIDTSATTAALLNALSQSVTQAGNKVQSLQAASTAIKGVMYSSSRSSDDPASAAAAVETVSAGAGQAARVLETIAKAKASALATGVPQQQQQVGAASISNNSARLGNSSMMLRRLAAAVATAAAAAPRMPAGNIAPARTPEACSESSSQHAWTQSLRRSSSNSTNSSSSNSVGPLRACTTADAATAAAAADSSVPRFQSLEQLLLSVAQLQRRQR